MIADPAVKNRVMIDVMNEPDARGLRWAAHGLCDADGFRVWGALTGTKATPSPQRVRACDTT